MRHRQIAALGLLVVLGAAVMVPAVALTDLGAVAQEESTNNETESAGLGTQLSSFAQASAADAESGVDRGLWEVQANRTTGDNESAELITNRATELEGRLAALQNRTEHLEQNRENLTNATYNARASALRSQIANVRSAIDQANRTAADRGVDTEQLDRLRNNAANMTGPEVAAIVRNITDAPRGPPEGVPGSGGPTENASGPGQPDTVDSEERPGEASERDNGSTAPETPSESGADTGNQTAGDTGAEDDTADDPATTGSSDADDKDTPSDNQSDSDTETEKSQDSPGSGGLSGR